MKLPPIAFALALASGVATAQNLIRNGDFENGANGWTTSGYALNPGVVSYDTTGIGASQCYSLLPGQQVFQQHVTYVLAQKVPMAPNGVYEFTADIASEHINTAANADGGQIHVDLVGTTTQSVTKFQFGRIGAQSRLRNRICARFVAQQAGLIDVQISFFRNYLSSIGVTPVNYIDNVTLQFANDPVICFRGERILGQPVPYEVHGAANGAFVMFAAPLALPAPIQIPGITGNWYLDIATLVMLQNGALNASGQFSAQIVMPNLAALDKLPIWFQGLQLANNTLSVGPAHPIGWHQ